MGDPLEDGRRAYAESAWAEAVGRLTEADRSERLGPEDAERLGMAAHLAGHVAASDDHLARAHRAWQEAGDAPRAARVAFLLGLILVDRGEMAPASGWFGRADRVLEGVPECAAHGFLLIPAALGALGSGSPGEALDHFEAAGRIGERSGDVDLCSLSMLGQGQARVLLGDVAAGLALLDEVMVGVVAGDTSPFVAGIAYCAVIEACHGVLDVARATEWTDALSVWCESQPDLQPYRGQCLVHRAELLRIHGAWDDALAELRRAQVLLGGAHERPAVGAAHFELGELHRLRGETEEAEEAYRAATRCGHDAQPGLALLRVLQGRPDEGWTALRARDPAPDAARAAAVLVATIELAIECGHPEALRPALEDLQELARSLATPYLDAIAAHAEGNVCLAEGDAAGACSPLRSAATRWQALRMPLHGARTRLLFGIARRDLGDAGTAALEFDLAREVFSALGARPDLDVLRALDQADDAAPLLTEREIEVLRLAADGLTNNEIAAALTISRHTVRRHLQNTFHKLGVSTRAAATAHAYERGLLR